jgi:hypothetical protein
MEWLVLVNWLLVLPLASLLGGSTLTGKVALGLPPLAAIGGLALTVIYLIEGSGDGLVWGSVACAAVGILSTGVGAVALVQSDGGAIDELNAGFAGLALPFFATAGLLAMLVPLDVVPGT